MFKKNIYYYSNRLKERMNGYDFPRLNMCIHEPLNYNGVNLFLCDCSSETVTGSFKDIVASYTIAYCLNNGISEFVTQSSGNTANSIAFYANKYKIRVTILYPKVSRYKIINNKYSKTYINFIELEREEFQIKKLTEFVAKECNIPWLPDFELQVEANKLRAFFTNHFSTLHDTSFDYISQAISSGFGIFGFYKGIDELSAFGKVRVPALIGVQQNIVAPYYNYLYEKTNEVQLCNMFEPTLFRSKPTSEMLSSMKSIVNKTNGLIVTVNQDEFNFFLKDTKSILGEKNLEILVKENVIIEKSGLLSLIGALKLIEDNKISKGSNILIMLTGGFSKKNNFGFTPTKVLYENDEDNLLLNMVRGF